MGSLHGYFRFVEPEMHWYPPSRPLLHCCPSALLLVIHNRCHCTSKGPSSIKPFNTKLIIRTSLRALPHRASRTVGKHAEPFGLLPSPLQLLHWLLLIFWFMLFYTVLINKTLQRIIKLTGKRKERKPWELIWFQWAQLLGNQFAPDESPELLLLSPDEKGVPSV